MFQTATFASVWKEAIVTLIYKKESELNFENYRTDKFILLSSSLLQK